MTETLEELADEIELQPVDSAGCAYGEIKRPAKTYYGRDEVEIKIPEAPNGWIRTEDSVSLEGNR